MKFHYTESQELKEIAGQLKARYYSLIGHVQLDKIFFAFKGGELPEDFLYEIQGLKSDWVKHTNETPMYCIAYSYDYYSKITPALLQWTLLECLYSCSGDMDGKLKRKEINEFAAFAKTLEDLGQSIDWRANMHVPALLEEETIFFHQE